MDRSRLLEGNIPEKILDLNPHQFYALQNMYSCRTMDKGGRILYCADCGNSVIVYNPCNQRGCPVCSKKNQILWANKLKGKLLPIGHYHLIFSLPEQMVKIWQIDKILFINCFFHAVQKAFQKMQKDMGITFGIVMIFQSHGQGLSYKPHMHCIVTDHGIDKDKKWVHCKTLSYNMLRDSVREILIPHIIKKMYPWWRNQVRKILETCDDKKWSVYPAIHKFSGERIVNYLSKSVSGVVLDIENDLDFNREEMTYTIRDRHMLDERTTTLDAHTFWDRYLNHIPPKGAVTIRNYGLYSNRYKEVLERIRIDEHGIESSREEILDYEEECGSCHGKMVTKEAFSYPDIPLIMRLHIQKNNSPPEHGFSFQTEKLVLS